MDNSRDLIRDSSFFFLFFFFFRHSFRNSSQGSFIDFSELFYWFLQWFIIGLFQDSSRIGVRNFYRDIFREYFRDFFNDFSRNASGILSLTFPWMPYKIFSDCFRILSRTYFEILPRISLRSVMDCSRDSLMNFCWFLLYSFRTPPEIASRKPSRNFFWASFWDSSRKLLSDSFKNSSGNLWEYFFRDSSYNWSRFYFPEIRSLPWGAGANTGWRSLNRTRFHNLGLYFQQMMSANFPLPLRFPPHYGHHRQIGIPSGTMTSCHPGRNGTRCWWRRKRTRGSTRILRLLRWWELRGLSKLPRVIFIAVVVVDLSLRKTPIRRHKTTSASLPQTQRYAQFFFPFFFSGAWICWEKFLSIW